MRILILVTLLTGFSTTLFASDDSNQLAENVMVTCDGARVPYDKLNDKNVELQYNIDVVVSVSADKREIDISPNTRIYLQEIPYSWLTGNSYSVKVIDNRKRFLAKGIKREQMSITIVEKIDVNLVSGTGQISLVSHLFGPLHSDIIELFQLKNCERTDTPRFKDL